MPARKRETEAWWTDAEASSASGGHTAPAHAAGGHLDSLTDVSVDAEEGAHGMHNDGAEERSERTEVIPSGSLRAADSQRMATPVRSTRYGERRVRPAVRRVKRTLRHVDPFSILKLSLFYYGCLLLISLVVLAIVYGILASMGLFEFLDGVGEGFGLWERLDITFWFVERWALFIGLTLSVLASIVNLFLAFLYNLASDVVGGAELTFVERDI